MRSSARKTTFSCVLLILIVLAYWIYNRRSHGATTTNQDDQPKEKRDIYDTLEREGANIKGHRKKTRQNIIIVSHGSSGSSITGDIFNQHPSVFYLHEPLQAVERIHKQDKSSGTTYGKIMADVLRSIFRCNFTEAIAKDFKYYYHNFSPRASVAISSPPLCPYNMTDSRWDPANCPPLTSENLNKVCRKNYEVTVIKILINRIDEANIKNVLAACTEPGIDCKVILLIRDPRAVIASSRAVGFFSDGKISEGKPGLRNFSKLKCQQTEENLASIRSLSSFWSNRIMIQRYEDFAMNPMKALSEYLKFAGLKEQESLRLWLKRRTNPDDHKGVHKECELKGKYHSMCNIDNAAKAVNRWRWKVPLDDVVIMEQYCKHTMELMGYKPVDLSQQLLSNISIALF